MIPVGGFLIALAVFGHRIGRPIAWTDEGVTYVTLQRTWANLMPLWQGRDSPLFPYYVLAKLWSDTLTGLGWTYSIALIRGLSAVALAGTTVVLYLFVSRHQGRLTGILAAALFVALPGVVRYGQEARPYALLMLASAVAWWSFDLWSTDLAADTLRPRARRWLVPLVLVLSLISIPITSLFGLLQWGALGLVALVGTPIAPGHWWRQRLRLVAPIAIAAALALWPVIHMATFGTGPSRPVPPTVEAALSTLGKVLFSGVAPVPPVAGVMLLSLALLSLLALRRQESRSMIVGTWLWLVVPLAGGLIAATIHPQFNRVQYLVPLILPFAVLAAIGIAELANLARRVGSRRMGTALAGVVAFALLAVPVISMVPGNVAVRAATGHGNTASPVLKIARRLQSKHPDAKILLDGLGTAFYFAVPAPDLFDANALTWPDPSSPNVWRILYDDAHKMKVFRAATSVIWIHKRAAVPNPLFESLPEELRDAGLKMKYKRSEDGWRVSLHVRSR